MERSRCLQVLDLGLADYLEIERLQDHLVDRRLGGTVPDTLLLLEHPPVITLGRRGSLVDVYASEAQLAACGIGLHRSTRGGLVTYHGPGQVVGYPIVAVRSLGRSVPDYVHGLERAVIAALTLAGVAAHTEGSHAGVWTRLGKVAAIGVAIRHGVALHGFAVNLQPDLGRFSLINPCGLADRAVTSVERITGRQTDVTWFKRRLADAFCQEFGYAATESGERAANRLGVVTT